MESLYVYYGVDVILSYVFITSACKNILFQLATSKLWARLYEIIISDCSKIKSLCSEFYLNTFLVLILFLLVARMKITIS